MMCNRISRGSASVFACATGIIFAALYAGELGAREPVADRYARIERMSPEEKDELEEKRRRFLALSPEEQDRLRELHELIASSPNADQLQDTLSSYARWLANLSSAQRSKLLDIKDIDERIATMKELMKQQEESRFQQYARNLSLDDAKKILQWLENFVVKHEADIVGVSQGKFRERLLPEHTPDPDKRREYLISNWKFHFWRRDEGTPVPTPADFEQLIASLSQESQTVLNSLKDEERQARLSELVRAAALTRNYPPPTDDELLKFHASLSTQERERLEGFEGDQLKRELRRMYFFAMVQRARGGPRGGGPPGPPPGGFGPPRQGPGDAGRGRRDDGRDRGSDRDRNDDRNREGTRDRDDDDARRDERTSARGNEDKDCCNDNDACRGGVCRKMDNGRDAKRRA